MHTPDVLLQVTCTLVHNVMMLRHVMTSQMNTDDVMSSLSICLAYKRCRMVPIGLLVRSIRLFTSGTHACKDWCTDAPAFLEPTSFNIIDWVVVIAVSIRTALMPLHTPEASREHHHTFFLYRLHRTSVSSVGAHVHYLHHRRSTSQEAYCCRVGTLSPA